MEEFLTGALAAIGAGFLTNPLEVIKTRFQLQGELQPRGAYETKYRSFFHAAILITKHDGVLALQKGLLPALCHQVMLNGVRLGGYQLAEERKLNLKSNGEVSLLNTIVVGAAMGALGAYTGSPFFLMKTRMQAQASTAIAVGHQHKMENGMVGALTDIFKTEGVTGLWRGVSGAVVRLSIASGAQLGSFYVLREYCEDNPYYKIERGFTNTFVSSMIGGVIVAIVMAPFDVISTRLYNQGVDAKGRGMLYSSYLDCCRKVWAKEGPLGFYKGIVPCYMRIGPHTVFTFVFWEQLKSWQRQFNLGRNRV